MNVQEEEWEDVGEELDDIFLGDAELWRCVPFALHALPVVWAARRLCWLAGWLGWARV